MNDLLFFSLGTLVGLAIAFVILIIVDIKKGL